MHQPVKITYIGLAALALVAGVLAWRASFAPSFESSLADHGETHHLTQLQLANLKEYDGPLAAEGSGVSDHFQIGLVNSFANTSSAPSRVEFVFARDVQLPDLVEGPTPSPDATNRPMLELSLSSRRTVKGHRVRVQAKVEPVVQPGQACAMWKYQSGKVRFCVVDGVERVHDIREVHWGTSVTDGTGSTASPPALIGKTKRAASSR